MRVAELSPTTGRAHLRGIDLEDPALRHIAQEMLVLIGRYGRDPNDPETIRMAIDGGRHGYEQEQQRQQRTAARSTPVVYYVRVGDLIKIGTTGNLRDRMRGYPPNAALLASEPGGCKLEQQRLTQFADTRAERWEWFRQSPALIEHINSLRDEPLTVADLAA